LSKKIKAAIIGPGNIGIDLMYKLAASENIELIKMIGIYESSEGLELARNRGIEASAKGISALSEDDGVQIVFDATSAKGHLSNAKIIKDYRKYAVDLTPAAVGPYLVPAVSKEKISLDVDNYNMVTCGGQATIPIVSAISRVCPVSYSEIVATLSSRSAGPGTRAIYARVENPDQEKITKSVEEMVHVVQQYVPGYRMIVPPIFDGDKVTVMVQVEGAGDYLPKYSGNLDIMTCAAKAVAEELALQLLASGN
jgi:acetaldehyde dehydrogenase